MLDVLITSAGYHNCSAELKYWLLCSRENMWEMFLIRGQGEKQDCLVERLEGGWTSCHWRDNPKLICDMPTGNDHTKDTWAVSHLLMTQRWKKFRNYLRDSWERGIYRVGCSHPHGTMHTMRQASHGEAIPNIWMKVNDGCQTQNCAQGAQDGHKQAGGLAQRNSLQTEPHSPQGKPSVWSKGST